MMKTTRELRAGMVIELDDETYTIAGIGGPDKHGDIVVIFDRLIEGRSDMGVGADDLDVELWDVVG